MSQPVVYLVDASIYVFRAWFSVPDSMRGDNGQAVNAVYGFTRFLTELVEKTQPTHIAFAFDESLTSSFRNDIYPAYKMNRELPPKALSAQFELCQRIVKAAGFCSVAHQRYEADDLIATMAKKMREDGFQVVIVSADKDLTQIIRDEDIWWDFARNQQLDRLGVKAKFGVYPEAIEDFLGLCGDAVDNIPGVPGVGPKTAVGLLDAFADLTNLYENLPEVERLSIRGAKTLAQKLQVHKEQAFLSKRLATLAYDVPIEFSQSTLRCNDAEVAEFRQLVEILGGRAEGLFSRLLAISRQRFVE